MSRALNQKLVSIIVPVYNVEKYIKKCLDSIVSQTYKNIEIIIVNDGSEEDEDSIIREYLTHDKRIRYIRKEENEGLFKARVTGVKEANGEFIQFVDSDDYINQDFIRLLVEKADDDNSDMVFAKTVTCTPNGSETIFVFQNSELYKLPLEKAELQKAFWEQHGCAYLWHTIWNKLYRKTIWDKAIPYFEILNERHVMTEDIAFSSVLYFYADKASFAPNATYFYCKHSSASTNSHGISLKQYERQLNEVKRTFDFVRGFYIDKDDYYKKAVEQYRNYYARMWQRIAEEMKDPDRGEALSICEKLNPVEQINVSAMDDNYFCYMEIPYSNKIDEMKKYIIEGKEKVISFDVFDTLLVRPFFKPDDLMYFLDKKYECLYDGASSFYNIRKHGEDGCRKALCNELKEDITLQEIYSYIGEMYGVKEEDCEVLLKYEEQLELFFNKRRECGAELFDIAKLTGKKIVITSDMYLSEKFIRKLLESNGYDGYEKIFVSSEYRKLKKTGSLFKALLEELAVKAADVLHIGDDIIGDISAAETLGIHTMHLPKTKDAFCGNTERITNKHRAMMGQEIAGGYIGKKGFNDDAAYGAALTLAANKYFDNPYIGFNDFTDFNVDSYFAGYYVLGMNLIGQIEWLKKIIHEKNINRIFFTSRDGKLLMDAFNIAVDTGAMSISTEYLYVSRRSMLPWMVRDKSDFLELPIVYQKYSPKKIDDLLKFCISEDEDIWYSTLANEGIDYEKDFCSIEEYHLYMKLFLNGRYDQKKHEEAKNIVAGYMAYIESNDGIYDLGYSAAIHRAICSATGKHPYALFLHSDNDKHITNMRRGNFEIDEMIGTIPNISGLMREFFFSDTGGSCLGYEEKNGMYIPIIEEESKHYTDLFPIKMMQKGAIDMVKDFYGIFGDFLQYIGIRTEEFMMPFEGFLISPASIDTKMFVASYFEDKMYGRIEKVHVRDFCIQILLNQKGYREYDITKYFSELLKKYGKKHLAFFGTGKMCEAMCEDYPDVPVEVFLDNNPAKSGKLYRGKKIIRPEEYPNLKELYIVVVIAFYKEVEEQLRDLGLTKYDDYLNYLELF